jgi:hypothetical protein
MPSRAKRRRLPRLLATLRKRGTPSRIGHPVDHATPGYPASGTSRILVRRGHDYYARIDLTMDEIAEEGARAAAVLADVADCRCAWRAMAGPLLIYATTDGRHQEKGFADLILSLACWYFLQDAGMTRDLRSGYHNLAIADLPTETVDTLEIIEFSTGRMAAPRATILEASR